MGAAIPRPTHDRVSRGCAKRAQRYLGAQSGSDSASIGAQSTLDPGRAKVSLSGRRDTSRDGARYHSVGTAIPLAFCRSSARWAPRYLERMSFRFGCAEVIDGACWEKVASGGRRDTSRDGTKYHSVGAAIPLAFCRSSTRWAPRYFESMSFRFGCAEVVDAAYWEKVAPNGRRDTSQGGARYHSVGAAIPLRSGCVIGQERRGRNLLVLMVLTWDV